MQKFAYVSVLALLAAGCTTQIHNKDETITAPKVPFKAFSQVVAKPLTSAASKEEFPELAVQKVQEALNACLPEAFHGASYNPTTAAAGVPTLVLEPAVVDGKKVSFAQRFWFGAFAGSSAVLMEVKFIDARTRDVIAQPIFYAKANAMGAAWTFGATDNSMLTRLANDACDYVKNNKS